MREEEEAS
jgi:hypothetical protein